MKVKKKYSPMKPLRRAGSRSQRGAMLIEVLVSVLILAFGILGIVGLQARMTTNVTDAKYRAEAAYLADQLTGTMWSDAHGGPLGTAANNNLDQYKFADTATDCTGAFALSGASNASLVPWANDAGRLLPNAHAIVNVGAANLVKITLCWQSPNESIWHKHSVSTQILG